MYTLVLIYLVISVYINMIRCFMLYQFISNDWLCMYTLVLIYLVISVYINMIRCFMLYHLLVELQMKCKLLNLIVVAVVLLSF
jgi:hypothetical protein